VARVTHPLQGHIAWNFQDHDAHEHELVSQINGVLVNPDVLGKAASQSAGQVHPIKLKDQQAEEKEEQHGQVDPRENLA
jgi:hypothetical protein